MVSVSYKVVLSCLLSALLATAASGQNVRSGANGGSLYVKSSEQAGGGMEVSTLCSDKNFKGKCALYLYDKKSGKSMPVAMDAAQVKDLLAGKAPTGIRGFRKVMLGKRACYAVDKGNVTTIAVPLHDAYSIFTTETPGPEGNALPEVIERHRSPEQLVLLGQCYDVADRLWDNCIDNAGEDRTKMAACDKTYASDCGACAQNYRVAIIVSIKQAISANGGMPFEKH